MTVCLAAICGHNFVVGASDRLLTAGDIQFEPQQRKIHAITNSIVIMTAGDTSLQTEIVQRVFADVGARIAADPGNWWTVRDVADLYSRYCKQVRLRLAETAILAPLGLDATTWLAQQQQLAPQLVTRVATELLNFQAPGVEAIITGVDPTGTHLLVATNARIAAMDTVGFAAVGVGNWHANSQFMLAGHTRGKLVPESMLLVAAAKKRAEVAPGVGTGTDMFILGPTLGSYVEIGSDVVKRLEEIYIKFQKQQQKALTQAQKSVNRYVEELAATAIARQQAAAPKDAGGAEPPGAKDGGGEASVDEKDGRGETPPHTMDGGEPTGGQQ